MTKIAGMARFATRMLLGSRAARADRRRSRAAAHNPEAGIAALFLDAPARSDDTFEEEPIFILSAGWRSGSTLLQRLVASGEGVLIWGEPYDRATPIQRLAASAAPFSEAWPPAGYLKPDTDLARLAGSWTANLYPPQEALRAAHRAFLIELFAQPARALGATRWGLKEVRLGTAEAAYLQAIFPRARFLFIRRRIEDAYLSYRGFSGAMDWYATWPARPAFTPFGFARHWTRMVREIERAAARTGGILIEYEDLVAGRVDLAAVAAYCGTEMDAATLQKRIGAAAQKGMKGLSALERVLLALGRAAGQRLG